MKLFLDFFDSRNKKSEAKNFGNIIHTPIICDNIDEVAPVILLTPPPELHLLIGQVKKLFTALESVWPESENWLKNCNVKKEEYHGGSFSGNESRKLFKNIDRLEALSPPRSCAKFMNTFKSFSEVVSSCYGAEFHPEFKDKVAAFKKDFINLGISITPKVHTVIFHISEVCTITGRGLGPWSEQSG